MWAVELSPDTLLVKGVKLTRVDGIADDGTFAHLVMVIAEGYRNGDVDGDLVSIPMLLRSEAVHRFIAALTNVAERSEPLAERQMFTQWIRSCRESGEQPSEETRRTVDDAITLAGDAMGFNVSDRATVEAMLFGVAAAQSVHIALTDKKPDDEGFAETIVGALGLFIDGLDRRLPDIDGPQA
jgi:hypothetical protein